MRYKNYRDAQPHPRETEVFRFQFVNDEQEIQGESTKGLRAQALRRDREGGGVNQEDKFFDVVTLNICWIVDGKFDLGNGPYSLSLAVDDLFRRMPVWVDLRLDISHRKGRLGESSNAHCERWLREKHYYGKLSIQESIEVSSETLKKYHELWFFSMEESQGKLTLEEVLAVWDFMQHGGGVFGVGDHDLLGQALCGAIPRVRQMLHYGQDKRPNATNRKNNSVSKPSYRDIYSRGVQEDLMPMFLKSRRYPDYHLLNPRGMKFSVESLLYSERISLPHPVLAAPGFDLAVDILPDHNHEGEVAKPPDDERLNQMTLAQHLSDISMNGVGLKVFNCDTPLFPKSVIDEGNPLPWEIIGATDNASYLGIVSQPHVPVSQSENRNSEFGVVGAYNGHLAFVTDDKGHHRGVGRVVVDSSFHHWIRMNILPFDRGRGASGGLSDRALMAAYRKGIMFWLAPPERQKRFAVAALWHAVSDPVFNELLPRRVYTILSYYLMNGQLFLSHFESIYPHVVMRNWWVNFLPKDFQVIDLLSESSVPIDFQWEILDECMLGAIVQQFYLYFRISQREDENSFTENPDKYSFLVKKAQSAVAEALIEYRHSYLDERSAIFQSIGQRFP